MNGVVDITIPRPVRDALVEEGQAEEHRWVPDSGWTTFEIRGQADVSHAMELMRISYLRYALKTAPDARQFLKQESEAVHMSPRFVSLLEKLAPSPRS